MNVATEGKLQKVIKWISSAREENPEKSYQQLVNEAVLRFDLSPRDADFITEFYRAAQSDKQRQ